MKWNTGRTLLILALTPWQTEAVVLVMQVPPSFIKGEVIKERRQASVFCFWLTLYLLSAAIGSSVLGCAERLLNSYGDSFTWSCSAVHVQFLRYPWAKDSIPAYFKECLVGRALSLWGQWWKKESPFRHCWLMTVTLKIWSKKWWTWSSFYVTVLLYFITVCQIIPICFLFL